MIEFIILFYIIILLLTLMNILLTPKLKKYRTRNDPMISILIPMRNEERNVVELIENMKKLTYPNLEVIGLDDGSTDLTSQKWVEHTRGDQRFTLKFGNKLPEGWKGKVHACDQLAAFSSGDKLLFLDADARVEPSTLQHALGVMEAFQSAMVTGFPKFPTKPFLSKLLVPFQHILVLSHLPIFMANQTTKPAFTAAHGAFLFVDKQAYSEVGGMKQSKMQW
ncbi:glycosyltransferase family 2 protein [Mangrovibacillus cuniculi]|uniref:4,4'-diaponeurosporenoate glycosyltransferase n=1 Tax=Mangrovibacillus cuniculi TaxID=2593652 RepID=A0A7S8HFJ9_9BACI|nr:glycosyltransferase family 2 protein [Mangrovibacillus cuniculi]QPC46596.1 glycosyltransferase family 2 protein [Mangrovibacillus cuniculi]